MPDTKDKTAGSDESYTVKLLISAVHAALNELAEAIRLYGKNDFRTGQLYAYAECLEILQLCPSFRIPELDYDVEKRYDIR